MIGTKKKSLLVILSLVMVLVYAAAAMAAVSPAAYVDWDVTATVSATNSGTIEVDDINIDVTGDNVRGIYSYNNSNVYGTADITTNGYGGLGAYAQASSSLDITGDISTSGERARGMHAYSNSYMKGNIKIKTSGTDATGVYVYTNSSMDIVGTIQASGDYAHAVRAATNSYANVSADITTYGLNANGVYASDASVAVVRGNIVTYGDQADGVHAYLNSNLQMSGNIITNGAHTEGAMANNAEVTVNGNIKINGIESYGLGSVNEGIVNMNNGTLEVVDESSSAIKLETESEVNLTSVDILSGTLLVATTAGTLNAEDSMLVGDVLHGGIGGKAEMLEVNLKDSTLEGAILTMPGIGNQTGGVVDLDLENSTWLVGGDSNTNGKVTGDINSAIDYTEAPGETTVIIDELVGNPTITLKPGDQLNITNSTGNNGDFSSSNPDVLEVVTNPDGSVEIISKGEGDADLTYSYTAPDGSKHTVTVDGSSADPNGTGVTPDTGRSGGSSSGCNAGFGALFALLRLAVVAKKK